MAKSLKSKWKRKMRAIKRERYGKKELEKLKTMLGLTTDEEMKEEKLDDIAIVRAANEVKEQVSNKKVEGEHREGESEQDDVQICEPMEDGRPSFNKRTLKDQHGNYPVWLGSRKLKKAVKRNRSSKRDLKKKGKKCGKTR